MIGHLYLPFSNSHRLQLWSATFIYHSQILIGFNYDRPPLFTILIGFNYGRPPLFTILKFLEALIWVTHN